MGFLQNQAYLNAEPINYFGGIAVPGLDNCKFSTHGSELNFMISAADNYDGDGDSQLQKSGFPNGYRDPYQITLPIKNGGMSAYAGIVGESEVTLNIYAGKALGATLTGTGTLTPVMSALSLLMSTVTGAGSFTTGQVNFGSTMSAGLTGSGSVTGNFNLLAFFEAAIQGSGAITPPELQLTVGLAAELAGAGDVTGSFNMLTFLASEIVGSGNVTSAALQTLSQLSANVEGEGNITEAHLSALCLLVAEIIGNGNIDAVIRSDCYMSAEITSAGELVTPQSCAQAVWSAVASAFNDAGTMGNKLNTASSGGVDLNALAEAIIAALNATTIPVDTKKINGVEISGDGTPEDPWGPA